MYDATAWTQAHDAWLRRQRFASGRLALVFDECYSRVLDAKARRDALDDEIAALAATPPFVDTLSLRLDAAHSIWVVERSPATETRRQSTGVPIQGYLLDGRSGRAAALTGFAGRRCSAVPALAVELGAVLGLAGAVFSSVSRVLVSAAAVRVVIRTIVDSRSVAYWPANVGPAITA